MGRDASLEDWVGRPLPDRSLLDDSGTRFDLRGRIGAGPLVLFFYIRNGTPG